MLKNRDGQFPAHGRKVIEEDIDGVPRFKMVEKRLDRHSRSDEDGRSAVDLGINGDELRHGAGVSEVLTQPVYCRVGLL